MGEKTIRMGCIVLGGAVQNSYPEQQLKEQTRSARGENQSNIDSMYRDWERLVSGVDPTGSKGKLEGLVKEEDKGWAVSGRKA